MRKPRPVGFMVRVPLGLFTLLAALISCQSDYPQIRAYYQERGISHCLAGNCMQGAGKAALSEDYTYEGRFEDYVPHGAGALYKQGNLVYSGDWDGGYPADADARALFADKGTRRPEGSNLGPKVKDYGDQGFFNGLFSGLCLLARSPCATPRRR